MATQVHGSLTAAASARRYRPNARRVARGPVAIVVAGAAVSTAVLIGMVASAESVPIGSPVVLAALSTASIVARMLSSGLFYLRAHRDEQLHDVLIASALTLLTVVMFFDDLLPILTGDLNDPSDAASRDAAHLFASVLIATAAFAPARRLDGAPAWTVGLFALGLLFAAGTASAGLGEEHGLVAFRLLAAAVGCAAAVRFLTWPDQRRDPLMRWLSFSLAFFAMHLATLAMSPTAPATGTLVADLFRVVSAMLLLVGLISELERFYASIATRSIRAERKRLASELHDGLAQELAYVMTEMRRDANLSGGHAVDQELVLAVVGRALEESRLQIAALTRAPDEPFAVTLERAAYSIAERRGVEVELDRVDDVQLVDGVRETLLRVLAEAIGNAARHGGARKVRVELATDEGLRFSVDDDGRGFDPSKPLRPDAFGLLSMRERVEALGGRLAIDSMPGRGTRVAVHLP